MAILESPGIEVTVIDESFYNPAPAGTTPIVFVATSQDKRNASNSGTAQGTTAANNGKVWVITSQRDLTDTFGTPYFQTSPTGNPVHGSEINEYGLQTAYSLLGVTSRVYVVRADVNLTELEPTTDVPVGPPVAGTYWIDTDNTAFGINEWNTATLSFSVINPLIIDNDNYNTNSSTGIPKDSFGTRGDYAVYITSDNGQTYPNQLYYKTGATSSAWVQVANTFDGGKQFVINPHTKYPNWTASTPNGSIWLKTTSPGNGSNWNVNYYEGSTKQWKKITANVYRSLENAIYTLDATGGGANITAGTVIVATDYNDIASADFKVWRKSASGPTTLTIQSTAKASGTTSFDIRVTNVNTGSWSSFTSITVPGSPTANLTETIATAIGVAGILNISAAYDAATATLTITHTKGGIFEILDNLGSPFFSMGVTPYNSVTKLGTANVYNSPTGHSVTYLITNWRPLSYEAKSTYPYTLPNDGALWYNNTISEVDIMYHNGTTWIGYKNAFPASSPAGPIIGALEPDPATGQSDGTPLVNGDIWIDTSDPEQYGKMVYVWSSSANKWIIQDVTDQTSPTGWLFADARYATTGTTMTPSTIGSLLISNYLDPDAPDPALYPAGTRLWNTRRSGNNVKQFISGYINIFANGGNNIRFNNESMARYDTNRWVSYYSVNEDGSGRFGRMAQRGVVVSSLKSLIDTNGAIRDVETLAFNLIACPGYPEVIQNMIAFNTDCGEVAFIVGDTPFRLAPSGTTLSEWGNNSMLAFDNGDEGAVSYSEYLGLFYPSGFTNDNFGNNIVVPPSHMMLRTIITSDAKSYPWFAPAGTRRGGIENASSVGYIDMEGEFKTASLHQGLRDVMAKVKINPIATLPGVGLVNFGQYTRARNASALDRINVIRLIVYLRRQLGILAKPFLFEPNDAQTRREIKAAVESLLIELVGQRALYDFIVVCDATNNTTARIDRGELYVDVAIEPVKAVEFIYIPLRIKNTGDIQAGL